MLKPVVIAAVLFYNNATWILGLLTRYDVVVFDEVQTLSFDNPGEAIGVLKDYMESGRFSRGRQQVSAEASIVVLANVPLDSSKHPANEMLFLHLLAFLQETAFIDRLISTQWYRVALLDINQMGRCAIW